jgi:hypothetical protein
VVHGGQLQGMFVDESHMTADGRVAYINRVCSQSVHDTLDLWLTPGPKPVRGEEGTVYIYYWQMSGDCGAVFRMLKEAKMRYHHFSTVDEIKVSVQR